MQQCKQKRGGTNGFISILVKKVFHKSSLYHRVMTNMVDTCKRLAFV